MSWLEEDLKIDVCMEVRKTKFRRILTKVRWVTAELQV